MLYATSVWNQKKKKKKGKGAAKQDQQSYNDGD